MHGDKPQTSSTIPKSPGGVVILGGAHGTLALARSLGRRRIPVWLISNDNPLPGWSRYIRRTLRWNGPSIADATAFLLKTAKTHHLDGFLLVPAGDAEVRFVSEMREALSACYRISLPAWEDLKWVCEKPLLYRRAAELGVDVPTTHSFATFEDAASADLRFPVVLKPNMGGGHDPFSRAKVVRADDRTSFLAAYGEATGQVGPGNVVVQELIPGGGESQFSYAALWSEGWPVAEFTARRTRQYPVEFGYTSTYVEVVEAPRAVEAARRILGSIQYSGLVEVEFKHDRRDNKLRLLDVNPRPWSWFGLASAAGVDLGAMLWTVARGGKVEPSPAWPDVSWMYLVRDLTAAGKLISAGHLRVGEYLRSFASVRAWATFSALDVVPGLLDIPLTVWRVLTRRLFKIY